MNSGIFYREKNKLFVLVFQDFEKEIPFERLKNGMANKENIGYYTITKIKERMVNIPHFLVIQDGEILENPFSISTNRIKDLFEVAETNFVPINSANSMEPKYEEFELELLGMGFYRADKTHFFRGAKVEDFERRVHKTKNK